MLPPLPALLPVLVPLPLLPGGARLLLSLLLLGGHAHPSFVLFVAGGLAPGLQKHAGARHHELSCLAASFVGVPNRSAKLEWMFQWQNSHAEAP